MDPVSSVQSLQSIPAAQTAQSVSAIMVGTGIVLAGTVMLSIGAMADTMLNHFKARQSGKADLLASNSISNPTLGQDTDLS